MNDICKEMGHDPKLVGGDDSMQIRCSRCGAYYEETDCHCEAVEIVAPPKGLEFASELVLLRCKKCGRSQPT